MFGLPDDKIERKIKSSQKEDSKKLLKRIKKEGYLFCPVCGAEHGLDLSAFLSKKKNQAYLFCENKPCNRHIYVIKF